MRNKETRGEHQRDPLLSYNMRQGCAQTSAGDALLWNGSSGDRRVEGFLAGESGRPSKLAELQWDQRGNGSIVIDYFLNPTQ